MKVFAGFIAASSATLLFDSRMHLSEGARCFVDCERELIGSAFRCEIEWGPGTDDYYRCFAKAEEEFNKCYFDEETGCPEGCGRICEPDLSAGMERCYELVDEGIIVGDIPLAICINKFMVTALPRQPVNKKQTQRQLEMLTCVENCLCDVQTECTCMRVSAPFLQLPGDTSPAAICVYPEEPEE